MTDDPKAPTSSEQSEQTEASGDIHANESASPERRSQAPAPEMPIKDDDGAPRHSGIEAGSSAMAEAHYRPSYAFLIGVSFLSLALDLGTKVWAKSRLEDPKSFADRRIEVIPKFMGFTFAKNRGGAWGLLQDQPESIRRPFFLGISVLAIIFIVSLYRRLTPQQTALKWGLPLVLGGALGNLVNRIQYNYVVDFIDVYARWGERTHHWPTFNVADIAICVGVGLMAVDMFTSRKPKASPGELTSLDAGSTRTSAEGIAHDKQATSSTEPRHTEGS